MSEERKKLSEIQFKLLVDAQLKYNNAVDELSSRDVELNKVRALVFDAVGLPEDTVVMIDSATQELIIQTPEPTG